MVTVERIAGQSDGRSTEFRGLSTDTKPIGDDIPNGSSFFETDTFDIYFYNKETNSWITKE